MKRETIWKRCMAVAALLICCAIGADAQALEAFSIDGKAPASLKKVYLIDVANRNAVMDSASVTAGKFKFSGNTQKNLVLGVSDGDFIALFINDGTPIQLDMNDHKLKGSAQNEKLNAYDRELTPIDTQMSSILQKARGGNLSSGQMDSIRNAYMALNEKKEARLKQIVLQNADNMIPAAFVGDLAYGLSFDELKKICNPANAYYNHPSMALPKRLYEGLKKRAPGMLFTDMTIPDMDGKEHKLSEWIGKGQYVMVDFWASWCGPCRGEMPNVVANYTKYHPKGFEIIGISFDRSAEPWKKAVEQMQMKWPQLSDLGYWQSAAAGVYGISSIPASILFDGSGKVVATDLRGEQLGKKLKEIYGF
ncbi:MAG: AhpC/TSA family protein [Prevotella sp.]|nr:AhpC/TSA family protein [Prevotella sp.]